METVLFIISILLLLVAFAGCFLPMLPGPTLAYIALLMRHFFTTPEKPYSTTFLVAMGIAMAVVFVLDYVIPGWLVRKTGGSKAGSRGALIGMIAGVIFTPLGMLLGMFLGAFIGELISSNDFGRSLRMAVFSFLGFLLSTGMKFIYCIVVTWYFFFPAP
ncbi:membrane protein [Bacteroidia bacterium]|nr:membrane protein [Bacteroidia bacterium]